MKRKCKDFISIIIILVLLPYIITLFMNGKEMKTTAASKEKSVKVLAGNKKTPTIVEVPWNDYLAGILAREAPGEYEEEALKAQAVLIRTRLYKALETHLSTGEGAGDYVFQEEYWNVEEIEQQWRNHAKDNSTIKKYMEKLERAVKGTDNLILTYEGGIANAPYHQVNNGSTRIGSEVLGKTEYPYLAAKECPADKAAGNQMTIVTKSYEEIGAGIKFEDIEILEKDTAGYATSIKVGENTYLGEEFRKDFNLSSSCINFQDYHGKMRITTQGIGHGLGLSQYSANDMAKKGQSCEDILKYFFEGINIEDGGEIFAKLE